MTLEQRFQTEPISGAFLLAATSPPRTTSGITSRMNFWHANSSHATTMIFSNCMRARA